MEYLSADKILVVDLATAETQEDELSESLVQEKIGGAAITKHLYEKYADEDPIVVGTGLLTGTLFPAAAGGVITAKSPLTGKVGHCPITLKVALEIQFSGFDYIVIKGKSDKPAFLWVHDGIADIEDAGDVWGKDVWETTDTWRNVMGEDLIQTIVIGKAGEDASDLAQLCCNYWGSADRFGFGKLFGERNLKGMAFRGMGLLEIADPEEFIERSLEILEEVKEGDFSGKAGLTDMLDALGHGDVKDWLAPVVQRHNADYNTPYATNTFVYLDEDPKMVPETKVAEPGFMVTDIDALLAFHKAGLTAEDACRTLRACAKYGINAFAVAELSQAAGKKSFADIEGSLAGLSGNVTVPGKGIFSPWCPAQPIFGSFDDAQSDVEKWWERRQAVAYIFGIHPIFAVISPEIIEDDLLDLANIGTEMELTEETLDSAINALLA